MEVADSNGIIALTPFIADQIRITGVSGTLDNFLFDFVGADHVENEIPHRQNKRLQSVLMKGISKFVNQI